MFAKQNSILRLFSVIVLLAAGVAALGVLGAGCATSNRTANLLAASGFKIVPATTPEQLQHLKTLPGGKISFVKRNGQVFFVYPDSAHKQIYVGRNAEYDAYQKLLMEQQQAKLYGQIASDNRVATEANVQSQAMNEAENAAWANAWAGPWGVWGPWGFW